MSNITFPSSEAISVSTTTLSNQSSGEIIKGLFLGTKIDGIQVFRKNPNEIHALVSLVDLGRLSIRDPSIEIFTLSRVGTWKDLVAKATDPQLPQTPENLFGLAFDCIEKYLKQDKNVLVHCCNGEDRSVTLVIAYLMGRKGMSFENALEFVKNRYSSINLGKAMIEGLKEYEIELNRCRVDSGLPSSET